MKFKHFTIVLILLFVFDSCAIEKRRYRKGFYIHKLHSFHNGSVQTEEKNDLDGSPKEKNDSVNTVTITDDPETATNHFGLNTNSLVKDVYAEKNGKKIAFHRESEKNVNIPISQKKEIRKFFTSTPVTISQAKNQEWRVLLAIFCVALMVIGIIIMIASFSMTYYSAFWGMTFGIGEAFMHFMKGFLLFGVSCTIFILQCIKIRKIRQDQKKQPAT